PHAQLRAFIGAGQVLSMSVEPVAPHPAQRDRLLATVARTPQEHRGASQQREAPAARAGWLDWLSPRLARPLAVAAIAGVLVVGAWNLTLQSQLDQQDRVLRSVAEAISGGEVAFRVQGSAGRGYVVDTPGVGAALVIADLAALPADRIYELWLIDAAGTPLAVGTFTTSSDAIAVVQVERDLAQFATFAVTVEAQRVDTPSGAPVMVGSLES
ncbi:MAG: anti-sigma factor, partial [Chloroflexota bacterium]|nr:anti-sigma factor [Chloroflexota bacterium]